MTRTRCWLPLLILLIAAGCHQVPPSKADVRTAFLEGRMQGDPCETYGYYADGVCDDWCPDVDPDCGARSACEAAGVDYFCAPFGPDSEGFGCPIDTRAVPALSCDGVDGLVREAVCCEVGYREPMHCAALDGMCVPDPEDGEPAECPVGYVPNPSAPCIPGATGPALGATCCVPEPPSRDCPSIGGVCVSHGDGDEPASCPDGYGPSPEDLCVPAATGPHVGATCCVPDAPPPATDCEAAGDDHFCALYGPRSEGFGCPLDTVSVPELSCGELSESICCVAGYREPPPPATDCEAAGDDHFCALYGPRSEGFGCPLDTVSVPELSCGELSESICCVAGYREPTPPDCRTEGCPPDHECQETPEGYQCLGDGPRR